MTPSIDTYINFANQLADESGQILRDYFRQPLTIHDKADMSPVTIADQKVEMQLRLLIGHTYPEHGIYGEEMGETAIDAEYVWVIDPIDGTKSFITGKPLFGTLIALLHHGKPILGVIDQPILRERWIGVKNLPTTLNGQGVTVRRCDDLSKAYLYATTPHMFTGQDTMRFGKVASEVKHPLYGADCYAYALLANGFVDLVIEADLSPYDYCALIPVIEQAGGIITDWQGQPLTLQSDGRVIAAGDKSVHQQALQILNSEI